MARGILVEGLSGTGKTTSWRTIPAENAMVISPNGKRLPFPGASKKYIPLDMTTGKGNIISTNKLNDIPMWLQWINKAKHIKYVLLDD